MKTILHEDVLDATGEPIRRGQLYGYTSVTGSRVRVVHGVAESLTPQLRVALLVTNIKNYLYAREVPKQVAEGNVTADRITISSFMLFPVHKEQP